jgi:hypothetical protein
MANRHSPPPPQAPKRTAAQMRNVISRIERVIRELQDFDPTTVRDRSEPRIRSLEVSIDQVLQAIELLNRAIQALKDKIADEETTSQEPATVSAEFSKDVFIVHGHDDTAKKEVAQLIERAGLNALSAIATAGMNGKRCIDPLQLCLRSPESLSPRTGWRLTPNASSSPGELRWQARLAQSRRGLVSPAVLRQPAPVPPRRFAPRAGPCSLPSACEAVRIWCGRG